MRRKNFIREFPHYIPTGNVYDSGNYDAVLDKALELVGYDHWRAEQARGAGGRALHRHRTDRRPRSAASSPPPNSGSGSTSPPRR